MEKQKAHQDQRKTCTPCAAGTHRKGLTLAIDCGGMGKQAMALNLGTRTGFECLQIPGNMVGGPGGSASGILLVVS